MSPWRRRIAAITFCFFLGNVPVAAESIDDPPTNDDVESTIADALPAYWSLHGSLVTGPVNYGTAVEPEFVWRFETVITPKEPLYVQEGTRANVVLLQPTLKPGDDERIYGLVGATFHAGNWRLQVAPENKPYENRGQPASYFPGRTVVIGSAEEEVEFAAAHRRTVQLLQSEHEAELAALKLEHQSALDKAGETHGAALAAARASHEADLAALKTRNARAVDEATETHRGTLAQLELELKAKADQHRLEIAQAESLTELAQTAARKLGALREKETEMLAATEALFGVRQSAVEDLLAQLGAPFSPQSYQTLIVTVSETESDWLVEAVLRHGLEADEQALNETAWIHLIQNDLAGPPTLRPILADHVADMADSPRIRAVLQDRLAAAGESSRLVSFLAEHAPTFSGVPEVARVIREALPSLSQWATTLVAFSSRYGSGADYDATQVLGSPNVQSCDDSAAAWAPATKDAGEEYVRVSFATPVWFPEVGVHENYSVGAVRRIVLWDDEGGSTEYEVQDNLETCPGVARFRFEEHHQPVQELTVVLNTKSVPGWNEIDAISLTGTVLANQ